MGLSLVSCEDILDTAPATQVASGNMWTSENFADMGMAGIWRSFYNTNLNNCKIQDINGLNRPGLESYGFATAYFTNGRTNNYLVQATKSATDWNISHEWKFCYTIIHSCNDAIANLHKATDMSASKLQRYYCEARFMRAWAYHRLNCYFQGVPVYLEPVNNADCTRTQSTADEVWQVILDDLDWCIDNPDFPDNTLGNDLYGRPSKGAAYALRGNVKMWTEDYQGAADDFAQVEKCGYGLWEGEYFDLFQPANERTKEMILPLQFNKEPGYYDNLQLSIAPRDAYESWDEWYPSVDFVNSFRNADGSEFHWNEVPGLEDWDKLTVKQREVFFARDGLLTSKVSGMATYRKQVIGRVGQDIFDKYYLDKGNEDRIRAAYSNRDPRLQQIVVTPYTPINVTHQSNNGGKQQMNKELRWPAYNNQSYDGGDLRTDRVTTALYIYKKFVIWDPGIIEARNMCHTDWPLIRYTDVLLARAEALTRIGNISGAIELVNKVRNRAHMPDLVEGGTTPNSVNGKEEMLERVRYERRIEMCMEGIDFFDEVRWGTYKESKFQGQDKNGGKNWWGDIVCDTWHYSDDMWPMSAPSSEIQKNPSLKTREGWVY